MKKGKLSKAASLFLSLMLVLTMVPSVGTDMAWAADDTSGTTEAQPEISFRVFERSSVGSDAATYIRLTPGQSLAKDYSVVDTQVGGEYMASFDSDGKILLLNNYNRGTIKALGVEKLTVKLKGTNTIKFLSDQDTALFTDEKFGKIVDLTITSADSSPRGKLVLERQKDRDTQIYINGICTKSLILDNIDLEANIKNDVNKKECKVLDQEEGLTVNNSAVNINISDASKATVYGLYTFGGKINIDSSRVNVDFQNCKDEDSRTIFAIANSGEATAVGNGDGDIVINRSYVNIKGSNGTELDNETYKAQHGGIYANSKAEDGNYGKIKISGQSSVFIDGGSGKFGYGILDIASISSDSAANCAGVVIEDSSTLRISNVKYGISSYRRGVDMNDVLMTTVDADDTAVYGYFFDANNKNSGKYGLHVTGNSKVDLNACTNAVKVNADGVLQFAEGLIDLSEGGYLRMSITRNADDTIDSPTQAVGIITAEEVLNDAFRLGPNTAITSGAIRLHEDKSKEVYTAQSAAPTTLEDGQKKYELEFNYNNGDILNVKWNQDTNEVSWSDSSLLTKYDLTLEGAENNGSTEPEYKGLKTIEAYEGKSYTLPKNITDMMIPTMSYRIKVTPCTVNADWKTIDSMASYSNVKQATEEVGSLDLTKIGYWQIGWPAIESAHAYYYELKKYNDVTKKYETVLENSTISDLYDLRDALAATKDAVWWVSGSKYILSVTATAGGNKDNVLARGETTEPIVFGYNSLNGSSDSDLNAKLTTKVVRQTGWQYFEWINGDENTSNDFDPTKLLYGDEVTLTYKPTEGEQVNGWYVQSGVTSIETTERTESDGTETVSFTMPLGKVTAYPLIGTEKIKRIELTYDRSYNYESITNDQLILINARLDDPTYKDNKLSDVRIEWKNERGKTVVPNQGMNLEENYVGTVKLTPANGYCFTDATEVYMSEWEEYSEDAMNEGSFRDSDPITNGRIVDGIYYFDLYLINTAKVTVPRDNNDIPQFDKATTGDSFTGTDLYTFDYQTVEDAGNGAYNITAAAVKSDVGQMLFGHDPKLLIENNTYTGSLAFDGLGDNCVTLIADTKVPLYKTPSAPVLNYPSGTTFYADKDEGSYINIVNLDSSYMASLKNPNAKLYYKLDDGAVQSISISELKGDRNILFNMKGSLNVSKPTKAALTVWVDNSPKSIYTYYAVDAFNYSWQQPYKPILTPSGTEFLGTLTVELVNPLPNLKYYYTTAYVNPINDNYPENWGNLTEYTGPITINDTADIHIVGKGFKPGDGADGSFTNQTTVERYKYIYGEPVLNYPSGTSFHLPSTAENTRTFEGYIKLDDDYLATLKSGAKVYYTLSTEEGQPVHELENQTDCIPVTVTRNQNSIVTVWVDGSPKASYSYTAADMKDKDAVVVHPENGTKFANSMQISVESLVPNAEILYAIHDSASDTSSAEARTEYTKPIVLKRTADGNIKVYDGSKLVRELSGTSMKFSAILRYYNGDAFVYSDRVLNTYSLEDLSKNTEELHWVKVNDNVSLSPSEPYLVNGAASDDATGATAKFYPETGILELINYEGGSITTFCDTVIVPKGKNIVNGTIDADKYNLTIEGDGTASKSELIVNVQNSVANQEVYGIRARAKKIKISGNADVTVNVKNTAVVATIGIQGMNGGIEVSGAANLAVNVSGAGSTIAGMYVTANLTDMEHPILIDTTGNVSVDVSKPADMAAAVTMNNNAGDIVLKNVGTLTFKHLRESEVSRGLKYDADSYTRRQSYADGVYTTTYSPNRKSPSSGSSASSYSAKVSGTIISGGNAANKISVSLIDRSETAKYTQTVYGNSTAFTFNSVSEGAYTLKVEKAGHVTESRNIYVKEEALELSVELKQISIKGTVTSFGDEDALTTVELWKEGGDTAIETVTGKGCSFNYCFDSYTQLNSDYFVKVTKDGHAAYKSDVFRLLTSTVPYLLDVALTQTSVKISGTISFEGVDTETVDASKIPKASVSFKENDSDKSFTMNGVLDGNNVTTYQDTANLLPNTDYLMTVESEGYLTYAEIIHVGTKPMVKDITMKLLTGEEQRSVSGTVTSNGNADEDITVSLTENGYTEAAYETVVKGTTAAYAFGDVETGTYLMQVRKLGFKIAASELIVRNQPVVKYITLEPVKVSGTISVKAADGGAITVTMTKDGEKAPKYTAEVSAVTAGGDGDGNTIYTASYNFDKCGVLEPGTYSLTATQAPAAEGEDPVSCTAKNIIVAYNDCTQNLDLTKPAGVTVSGTVTSWNANNDVVYLMYAGDTDDSVIRADWKANKTTGVLYTTWGSSITANTDGKRYDQAFSFSGIAAGTYKLAILKPGHGIWIETITVESSDISGKKIELYRIGDVNGDGIVDIGDHQRLFEHLQGINIITDSYQLTVSNVNGDEVIDIGDHQRLFEHLQGINLLYN